MLNVSVNITRKKISLNIVNLQWDYLAPIPLLMSLLPQMMILEIQKYVISWRNQPYARPQKFLIGLQPGLSTHCNIFSSVSIATQTEDFHLQEVTFPQISTRKPSKVKGKEGVLIDPKILECIVECETTARCSLATAIEVTQIVANRIFGQKWLLPLSMDKDHLREVKYLKWNIRDEVTEMYEERKMREIPLLMYLHWSPMDPGPQCWGCILQFNLKMD